MTDTAGVEVLSEPCMAPTSTTYFVRGEVSLRVRGIPAPTDLTLKTTRYLRRFHGGPLSDQPSSDDRSRQAFDPKGKGRVHGWTFDKVEPLDHYLIRNFHLRRTLRRDRVKDKENHLFEVVHESHPIPTYLDVPQPREIMFRECLLVFVWALTQFLSGLTLLLYLCASKRISDKDYLCFTSTPNR